MADEDLRHATSVIDAGEINASATMQLATVRDSQPWNCSVYFVIYTGNFYWLSYPERRHSQDLSFNSRSAIAIVLQSSQPVIGIQAEGDVEVIQDINEAQIVLDLYVKKYNQGSEFMARFKEGNNKHSLYRFTPRRVMIFNEHETQPGTSPREVVIT